MNKERLNKVIDSFFNVDGGFSDEELKEFENEHSIISVGLMVVFAVLIIGAMLSLVPYGFDLDYILHS